MGRRVRAAAAALITLAAAAVLAQPSAGSAATASPAGVATDSLAAARALRLAGCAVPPGTATELLPDTRLDAAARDWSRGSELGVALVAAGASTRAVASLRTSATRAAALTEALRRNFCAELRDARYTRWGVHADDRGHWLLLAVPRRPPDPARAAETADAVLRATNEARAVARFCGDRALPVAPPLTLEPRLTSAARAYATELARTARLAHEGTGGSTPATRARGAGYEWRSVGENLAAGPETAPEVVADWLTSPGHCANLMDAGFTQMGLAFAIAPSDGRVRWVQLFGSPRTATR